ncbi:hypothetical protein BMR1_02g00355 [Babesia microti strain RI]|uniref:Uncharacterized protein n=1 Tax=Babesia microti (strain RI) TaxID=1133968 RepID=I7J5V2_BABMR|nr:hypothetical protein BMR1_02g00355 [Babesia microti strain RI]CCF73237.1 hypothetical protein BMR1_02g00355 [Babesia microti strain RI]|eukprot:XP_012647846.1 hypothetical protein BMR1_02g00355 [Babesia microti strain RI]
MSIAERPLTFDDWLVEQASEFKFFHIDQAAYQYNITVLRYTRVYSSLVAGLFAGAVPLRPRNAIITYFLVNIAFTFLVKHFSEKKHKLEFCFMYKYDLYTIAPFFGFMTFMFAWFMSYNFAFYELKG